MTAHDEMSRRARDDQGSAGIVLVAFLLALTAGAVLVTTYASKDEQSAKARTVADAAALAGALSGRDDLIGRLFNFPPSIPSVRCSSVGEESARTLAQENGGVLDSYCFDHTTGRAEVNVRVAKQGTGGFEYERAAASPRFMPDCREVTRPVEPTPSPTPTPTDDETEDPDPPVPTPTPSPEVEKFTQCSLGDLHFDSSNDLRLEQLKRLLEPRLVAVGD